MTKNIIQSGDVVSFESLTMGWLCSVSHAGY